MEREIPASYLQIQIHLLIKTLTFLESFSANILRYMHAPVHLHLGIKYVACKMNCNIIGYKLSLVKYILMQIFEKDKFVCLKISKTKSNVRSLLFVDWSKFQCPICQHFCYGPLLVQISLQHCQAPPWSICIIFNLEVLKRIFAH